ncbi:UNVERIFIED_CONTAM: hypothetical protein Sradi_3608800 [Sesamum radiatum]|uniref:Retrotransposon gag domain-containing protein n=1 Tax=Sesamum radiatum TaxID=300843 RepID=A0AAW2QID6_SESRA
MNAVFNAYVEDRAFYESVDRRVLILGGTCRLLRTASYTVLLSPHCGRRLVRSGIRPRVFTRLRRGVVTRSSSSAANMVGQDLESPRRAASPSGQAAIPEDETSRLAKTVMNLEENASSLEAEITRLNFKLEDCRQMSIRIGLLRPAVSNAPVVAHDAGARLRIPEPKAYGGARDVKEVENFLFDMEQYFLAANVEDEVRKVSTATMYLTGDAKLWWRTKYSEIQANQVRMDTWAFLRVTIRVQFFPENVECNARRALRKLEHTGSMKDFVKSFSMLMLDIRNMLEKDKLFTFMEDLKPWARLEL